MPESTFTALFEDNELERVVFFNEEYFKTTVNNVVPL